MQTLKRTSIIFLCALMIPVTAVVTASVKQRAADGSGRVFAGGPLVDGPLYAGGEPDWSFVADVPTVELQLLEPPETRTIWVAEADGKLYLWSGYMGTFVGRLWKRWPGQAERDGRAIVRIDGMRYPRHLIRVTQGEVLDRVSAAVSAKYPSRMTRAAIEAGDVWLFEAAPAKEHDETSL